MLMRLSSAPLELGDDGGEALGDLVLRHPLEPVAVMVATVG